MGDPAGNESGVESGVPKTPSRRIKTSWAVLTLVFRGEESPLETEAMVAVHQRTDERCLFHECSLKVHFMEVFLLYFGARFKCFRFVMYLSIDRGWWRRSNRHDAIRDRDNFSHARVPRLRHLASRRGENSWDLTTAQP